jgi:non-homologous end joining protein Ku
LIELDEFIEFFQVDPHYFERTFLLIPKNSEKPYALLRKVLEKTGLATGFLGFFSSTCATSLFILV